MRWHITHRADPIARRIADRHYNRQKPGATLFAPPGRCIVLVTDDRKALWISSWPYAEYVLHEWAGAWICSCFRNEGAGLSSGLIREAVAATRAVWGDPPELGFISFVNPEKVRRKRDFGRCFRKAGWKVIGETKVHGLLALQLPPEGVGQPVNPIGFQMSFAM